MISFYSVTDVGSRRHNEDRTAVFQDGERWCCVVADGLGGMRFGDEAAQLVIDTVGNCFAHGGMSGENLKECVQKAHQAICQRQAENHVIGTMLSTVALLYGEVERVWWLHCGDSRLYLYRNGELVQRTKDHSVPQMLASCGEIEEEEIRFHPDRNRLLACLGTEDENVRVSAVGTMETTVGFSALLCTDGFWEPVSDEELVRSMKRAKTVEQWLTNLQSKIEKRGKTKELDNHSAVGVWIR